MIALLMSFTQKWTHVDYKDVKSTKPIHTHSKPWWNSHLKPLWSDARSSEHKYRRAYGSEKRNLLCEFREKRRLFDQSYHSAERTFYAKQYMDIESLETSNPRGFWNKVNQLGPSNIKAPQKPCVRLDEDTVSFDKGIIMHKWYDDISGLFQEISSPIYDSHFYNQVCELNIEMEHLCEDDGLEWESTRMLNSLILLEEVTVSLGKAKPKKASGYDNLPNELLCRPEIRMTLCSLFNSCFALGVVPSDWCKSIIQPVLKKGKVPLNHRSVSLILTEAKV